MSEKIIDGADNSKMKEYIIEIIYTKANGEENIKTISVEAESEGDALTKHPPFIKHRDYMNITIRIKED